ncbi:MAG: AAA family ATPase [Caldicoprobacterales bacterium]|jgi:chromosome partitioning protein|nr:ParA family protein [Clostridiales bacterium]
MSKVFAIANQKGGVGKTTTNINLASGLANLGKKVLTIDIDPQGNTTSGLGIEKDNPDLLSIYDVLINQADIRKAIRQTQVENLDIVSSNLQLAGAEVELVLMDFREFKLKNAIESIRDMYDYIFIDCPPSLGLITINAFTAADGVLVPIQCEYFALEGLTQLLGTIQKVKQTSNPNLELEGVILTMFNARTNLSIQVVEEVKKYFRSKLFTTIIPRNVRLGEAPSHGLPIHLYDPKCVGAVAYAELAEEFLEREMEA